MTTTQKQIGMIVLAAVAAFVIARFLIPGKGFKFTNTP